MSLRLISRVCCFLPLAILNAALPLRVAADSTLAPSGMIKAEDLERAKKNLTKHDWAKAYQADLEKKVEPWIDKIDAAFLERFLPETTPGANLFTPCPSCREKELPYLPHGSWSWVPEDADQLICKVCKEIFPSANYPETITIKTTWGKPQTFSYIGGDPFPIFNYKSGRPSISGNIRCRKVLWTTDLVKDLSELYALTGTPAYAEATKAILLRLAEVYPFWLVHTAYGEIADMAPAEAAASISKLPKPEAVYPPNQPDRALFTGYWTAGRARSEGMEGIFVRAVATAYDFTRGAKRADGTALYTEEERKTVETQLLAESIPLLISDIAINNKSMGNRSGVGLVGIILKQPEWMRFGLEGFRRTINEWFLPDGGTPESPAYASMALRGIVDFGQALRGYSDPEGYKDQNGQRFDDYDPYQEPQYRKIWAAMFNTLQGDLRYPPFGDSYARTGIGSAYPELMAANYPDNLQYQALRKEVAGKNAPYGPYALYYSSGEESNAVIPPLSLPSHLLPELRIGWMRTGDDGREALALLSASHWGSHHHLDSLNLTYWNQGAELLSDLGYLWDHPDKKKTTRTLAHNTVLLDESDQVTRERGGTVSAFINEPRVKGMRASSFAYPKARRYERAVTLVDHGRTRHYIVDVFWTEGGRKQDYVYHGPNNDWTFATLESGNLRKPGEKWTTHDLTPEAGPLYDLKEVRQWKRAEGISRLQWQLADSRTFSAWHLPAQGETLYIGSGWGQRDSTNSDRGATLPYIVRRTQGAGLKTFVSVFEASPWGSSFVESVTPLPQSGAGVVALEVKTQRGHDIIVVAPDARPRQVTTSHGTLSTSGTLSLISLQDGKVEFDYTDASPGSVRFQPKPVQP